MIEKISAFLANDTGATAIEYALITAIIGTGIVVGLQSVRSELQSTLTTVQAELKYASN